MKKKFILCLIPMLLLTSCGYDNEVNIGIGDGSKKDDAVRICLKFNNTWEINKEAIYINFGHEKEAILHDKYDLSLSKENPIGSKTISLTGIFSFTKEMLEPKEVTEHNYEYTYQGDFTAIIFENFDFFEKTEKEQTKDLYFVFSHDSSDFSNITTFSTSKFFYSYDGSKVVINRE